MSRYLSGALNLPPHMRLMFPLRLFHVIQSDEPNAHDFDGIQKHQRLGRPPCHLAGRVPRGGLHALRKARTPPRSA